jgi:7-carboxy-7-deazaguanine synthase
MKIAEIFYSIQGEGSLVGAPSVFVRTSGCNLRCSWCDTPYTSWHPEGTDLSLEQIIEKVSSFPAPYVVITGGEPMIAPGVVELTRLVRGMGAHITIETAGTVFQEVECDLMSISPKLSNSTPEGVFRQQHERWRFQKEVLRRLMSAYEYQLKFVIAAPADVGEVQQVVSELEADPRRVILMPEGRDTDTLRGRGVWLAEICKELGYRLSPRLHVDLWGDRRGI